MASNTTFLFATVAILGILQNTTVSCRDLSSESSNIAARLQQSGGLMDCWNALYELKSCTDEIVLFFLNGETKLGVSCCKAVDVITTNCWPAMLTSLGFTSEEANVLRGFCQDPNSSDSSPAASPNKA
ncbi:Egg cell-secreted protein 1.4 [Raphanus sativus]|uniref:Egg cell-secreted protein 1.4-like n=1 Tax=Raphanus sativus TaxID=3726 RepID=A0A9W3BS24_RAPSA|nr:egg cell-secreted protein 1.4-like [Raphanus sativus]KAJ4892644.1 Egg cell-secreted protein 1.4 [Raphanus sativus]